MPQTQQHTGKRLFDLLFSLVLLPIVLPVLCIIWLLASISTRSNGWFVQTRIGQEGKSFKLYKIRTLKGHNHQDVLEMKAMETGFGRWLRATKLDELPQVFNVLKGDMSWVGPRPDIPGYADLLQGEDRLLLSVKPGITGPATLKYRNEEQLLLEQSNPKVYNDTIIWPDKVRINNQYVKEWSFWKDLDYLWHSIFS